jgi:lipoprotein signal peptidase
MGILMLFMKLIPPPMGADVTTEAGLKAALPLFEVKNFIGPFLAHALGTFVGAFIMAVITKNLRLSLIIGFSFLIGGAMEVANLSAPLWFNVLDLVMAYIPMAYLGFKLVGFLQAKKS